MKPRATHDRIPRPTLLDTAPDVALNNAWWRFFHSLLLPMRVIGSAVGAYRWTLRRRGR